MVTCLRDKVIPLTKEFKMKKLVGFLVALTEPETFAAVGLIVGLVVACVFGGH